MRIIMKEEEEAGARFLICAATGDNLEITLQLVI
jgi:hypothetical protein